MYFQYAIGCVQFNVSRSNHSLFVRPLGVLFYFFLVEKSATCTYAVIQFNDPSNPQTLHSVGRWA